MTTTLPRRAASAATAATAFGMLGWLLLGDLGIAMRDRAALPSGLELLRVAGASDTMTSLLLAVVPALLSLFVVPYVGWRSDRLRSRWGRRRPFLVVAAIVGGVTLGGIAASPALGGTLDTLLGAASPGLRACRLGVFAVFWTVFECAALCALSLFTGLVNDVVPFGWLGRFYAVLRIVSLSAGIAFNSWVFALTEHHLGTILAGTGIVFGVCILAMCAMVREGPPPADVPPKRSRAFFAECATAPGILWSFALFACASATFAPFNTFYQYHAHAAGVTKATLGLLTATGYVVSIVSAFGIGIAVDRWGAKRVSAAVMALYCGVAALGWRTLDDAAAFERVYLAHVIMSGAWFTAAASLPMALFPRERFVQFNATKDVVDVLTRIVLGTVQGPLLDFSGHDYRLTLLSGALFALLCLGCMARLRALTNHNDKRR